MENTQRILGPRLYQPIGVLWKNIIGLDWYCRGQTGWLGMPTIHGGQHNSYRVAPKSTQPSSLTSIHSSAFAKTRLQIKLADLLIDNEHLLHSQWLPGSANVIHGILSRYWHLDEINILNLLTHILSTQLHPYFWLSQVLSMIDSFLCSVLQSLPKPTQTQTKPKPNRFALGINDVSSWNQSALEAIYFWTDSAVSKDNSSWLPSQKLSDKPNFRRYQRRDWLRQQSEIPLDTYHRPSGQI